MNIAVITGASSGMGLQFALKLNSLDKDIDEFWLIARRKKRLEILSLKLGSKTRIFALDLEKTASIEELQKDLKNNNPKIKYLVNGYIDNPIADTLFLLNNCIIYNKYIEIKSYFEEWGFLAFYQKFVFVDRNIYVSLKQKRLILTSKEANSIVNGWPINNEEEFSSFLWSMRKMIPEYNSKTTDNDIVNKHYRNLRKIFRKLKIAPKEQEDYIYDCYLFDTMAN